MLLPLRETLAADSIAVRLEAITTASARSSWPGAGAAADATVRPEPRSLARAPVEVQQHFDGTLQVFHQGRCLATTQSGPGPSPLRLGSLTKPERDLPVQPHSQPRVQRNLQHPYRINDPRSHP